MNSSLLFRLVFTPFALTAMAVMTMVTMMAAVMMMVMSVVRVRFSRFVLIDRGICHGIVLNFLIFVHISLS